jgi:uncharacterized protein (DUF924 family)
MTHIMETQPEDIIDYWYADRIRPCWFKSTPELDQEIRSKYQPLWEIARQGQCDHWQRTPEGSLALVIVLDQFPLNMFRGQALAFATESQAVAVCLGALDRGFDKQLSKDKLAFLYMPLMHSEDLQHQSLSVQLYEAAGLQENARFARHHQQIVEKYGRFPHRNDILGRASSQAELAYLNSPEAFKG